MNKHTTSLANSEEFFFPSPRNQYNKIFSIRQFKMLIYYI
jgi:hypothetical protein